MKLRVHAVRRTVWCDGRKHFVCVRLSKTLGGPPANRWIRSLVSSVLCLFPSPRCYPRRRFYRVSIATNVYQTRITLYGYVMYRRVSVLLSNLPHDRNSMFIMMFVTYVQKFVAEHGHKEGLRVKHMSGPQGHEK
jgi:hypothetical protein